METQTFYSCCLFTQPDYSCSCCEGYKGQVCDDIDACANDPCLNYGTCIDIPNDPTGTKYQCQCILGKILSV